MGPFSVSVSTSPNILMKEEGFMSVLSTIFTVRSFMENRTLLLSSILLSRKPGEGKFDGIKLDDVNLLFSIEIE